MVEIQGFGGTREVDCIVFTVRARVKARAREDTNFRLHESVVLGRAQENDGLVYIY